MARVYCCTENNEEIMSETILLINSIIDVKLPTMETNTSTK